MNVRSTLEITGVRLLHPQIAAVAGPRPVGRAAPTPRRCRPTPTSSGLYRSTPGNKGALMRYVASRVIPHIFCWSRSGSPRRRSAPSLETTSAWRSTMTSTRIFCSNWSHAPHITRCTTGKRHTEFRVLSANAFRQQLANLSLSNDLATIARNYCFTVVVVILVAPRNSSERRRVQRLVSGRPGNPAHIRSNETSFFVSTVCPPSCAGSDTISTTGGKCHRCAGNAAALVMRSRPKQQVRMATPSLRIDLSLIGSLP